jgi:hypothetical protein
MKSLRTTLPDEIFYWGLCSLNLHFVNISVKNQQMQQLFIQLLIMYDISYMFLHYIAIIRESSSAF